MTQKINKDKLKNYNLEVAHCAMSNIIMGPTGSNRILLVCLTKSILVFYFETIFKHFLPLFENWAVLNNTVVGDNL